jgi:branched-chain amino acid transport system permease protein
MLIDRYILEKVRHNQTNVLIITFGVALLIQSAIPLFRYPWRPSELVSYEFIPFGIENKTLEGIVPKTDNIEILDQTLSSLRVVAALVSILILILVYLFISRSRMGKAMKAVSEDPEAAWLVGINVRKVYLISAGLGMGLSAAAGVLTSPFAASPSWGPFMGWSPLIFAIAVVTLGGIGSIFGSVIAGFIVGFTEATIAATDINLSEIVPLIVIFVIIIVRPKGLFGVEEHEE